MIDNTHYCITCKIVPADTETIPLCVACDKALFAWLDRNLDGSFKALEGEVVVTLDLDESIGYCKRCNVRCYEYTSLLCAVCELREIASEANRSA
jgi:hypothetical protein